MGKGLLAGGAGDSAAAAGAGVRAPLTARDLRDLRAVLRAVRDEGGVTLVRLRHFELELQPQHARSHLHRPRSRHASNKSHGKCTREAASAEPGRRMSAESASDTVCDFTGAACMDSNSACKGVKRRPRRGPAAAARSKARLEAFNDRKREQLLAASRLRARLNQALRRMRFERMWAVKRAHAEGKEMQVAPSLNEVMASLLPTCLPQQTPKEAAAGAKRAANSPPISTPTSAHLPEPGSPGATMDAKVLVKPSPLKRPRSRRKKCDVCGYMPFTCICKKYA